MSDAPPPAPIDPHDDAGPFRTLLFRATILPAILLLGLAVVLVLTILGLLNSASWVEHTDRVISEAHELQLGYADMQAARRGYELTRDPSFLAQYERGVALTARTHAALFDRVSDNPPQQAKLEAVERLGRTWQDYARASIERRKTSDAPVASTQGRQRMDDIRGGLAEFVGTEEALRRDRTDRARSTAARGLWGSTAAVLVVGGVLAMLGRREMRRLAGIYENALDESRRANDELERRVAERTEALHHANGALVESNRELEAFSYSVSHDLRAPLRHIGGFADLLRMSIGPTLDADDTENLTTIRDTAKTAGRMVDDLLGLSRIGRAEIKRNDVDMNALVADAQRELLPEAAGRHVTWDVSGLPPAVGDRALLKSVVVNLLSNALKYTSKQDQTTVRVSAAAGDDGQTVYAVADNGVGFDMTYAHKLFGVFQRLHRAEEYEGTGIGLANVRRIIGRHGGRTWAEGAPGQGATFYFSLPNRT